MKKIFLISLLLTSLNSFADEDLKKEKVEELMSLMNMTSIMEGMYSQLEVMMQNVSNEIDTKPENQPIIDEYYSRMALIMREEMGWKKFKDPIVKVYAENFSDDEITGMIEFYKSDIGQSTLKKLPLVMQESMQIGQSLAQNMMPKIEALVKEMKEEVKKNQQQAIDP